MYFINDEHVQHFEDLLEWSEQAEDRSFRSTAYIAAHPQIYRLIPAIGEMDAKRAKPLRHLAVFHENENRWEVDHPALTGGTSALVAFGLSLITSHVIHLKDVILSVDNSNFQVLQEAMRIFAGQEDVLEEADWKGFDGPLA